MRIILGFCLLMTGCCILKSHAVERISSTTEAVAPSDTSESVELATLLGFSIEDMRTPDPIPAEQLPEPDVYNINTRIVIEGQVVELTHGGEDIKGVWWSREIADVWRDLRNAEKVYQKTGVKFHVSDVSFQEYKPNIIDRFMDANRTPNILTITYMLPNGFVFDGYSSAPWEVVNRGVVVHYLADEWTLAHELGHYFGLLHPWNEDYVKDTPEQEEQFCTGPEFSTINCHNIMSYCDHEPKHVTPGQIDRFTRFLRAKRMNQYVREYTDIMLRSDEFPVPAGTRVIFNLSLENGQLNVEAEEKTPW